MFAELLAEARELLETGQPLLIDGEVRLEGDAVKVLASSVQALDAALANGGRPAREPIEVRLRDARAVERLADLLGPHGDGSARVRVVLPLDAEEEVAIELGEAHRLRAGAADRPRAPRRRARGGRPLSARRRPRGRADLPNRRRSH